MSENVDYQLRLARIRPRTSATVLRASLNSALLRTISVLRKTHEGENIHWQITLGDDLLVDIDEHDLLELAGIVLENAAKWAASRVVVTTASVGGHAVAQVTDDGPGLSKEQIAQIGARGTRISDERSGSGFGLAIALEIAATNGASIEFSSAPESGLTVEIALPSST
jgi:signal transduction histidine kinase